MLLEAALNAFTIYDFSSHIAFATSRNVEKYKDHCIWINDISNR